MFYSYLHVLYISNILKVRMYIVIKIAVLLFLITLISILFGSVLRNELIFCVSMVV